MSIRFYSEDVVFPKKLKRRITAAWLKYVIDFHQKRAGDVSIVFCSDTYLLDVNRKYLEHDYFTDIITFDYVEGDLVCGDIFISVDRVLENAGSFGVSFEEELNRVIAHGILHLLGFKDKEDFDKQVMTGKEDFCLKVLNDNFL
jgi:rRNA maturation RNase YbeY